MKAIIGKKVGMSQTLPPPTPVSRPLPRRQMPNVFPAKRPAPLQASAKTAKAPAASAAHTCCTATSACRAASRSSSWARSWATEPEPQRQKGRVLFSTRPFLFSISNLPCRLRHTKTYRNGRWVPCRSFTLPSSACGQGRAGGLRSPHIGLRAPFKWLVGLNIWRIKSHRAGCLPVYWPPLRSMSYNSSRRRANMSLTS